MQSIASVNLHAEAGTDTSCTLSGQVIANMIELFENFFSSESHAIDLGYPSIECHCPSASHRTKSIRAHSVWLALAQL